MNYRNKFLMDNAFVVEDGNQQCFHLWFLQTNLFYSPRIRWTPCHRLPFWFRIELVVTGLISRGDIFRKQWILVTHGNEVSRSFHLFSFLLVCELERHKSRADLPLTQIIADDGVRRVLMPNFSAINISVSRRFCASIFLTFSIISGALLVVGRPERGSSSVVYFPS